MITRIMERRKRIALVAHDNKKKELIEWAVFNKATLAKHAYMQQEQQAVCLKRSLINQ